MQNNKGTTYTLYLFIALHALDLSMHSVFECLVLTAQGSKCSHLGIDDQREAVGTTGSSSTSLLEDKLEMLHATHSHHGTLYIYMIHV